MKLITLTKPSTKLFNTITGYIALWSLKFEIPKKEPTVQTLVKLTSDVSILYSIEGELAKRRGQDHQIKHIVPKGAYTVNELNSQLQLLKTQPGWTAPKVVDGKIHIPAHHMFVAHNGIFDALGIKSSVIVSDTQKCLYTGAYDIQVTPTTIPAASPSKQAQLSCQQLDGESNEIDGQPSKVLLTADVTNNKVNFTTTYPIFLPLEQGRHHHNLEFTLTDEKNHTVKTSSFHLQLLNKHVSV